MKNLSPTLQKAIADARRTAAAMPADKALAERAIAAIDLTSLTGSESADDIRNLISDADGPGGRVAALCVFPDHVKQTAEGLKGTGVQTATVVNFPTGEDDAEGVARLTANAVASGADEIDVVFPWKAWAAGDQDAAGQVLRATRQAAEGRQMKVILESGAWDDAAELEAACRLSVSCGADFLKTSTGKIEAGASLEAAAVMMSVAADHNARNPASACGVKVSGGVSTAETAAEYMALGEALMGVDRMGPVHFRIGTSGLLPRMRALASGEPAPIAQHGGGAGPASTY